MLAELAAANAAFAVIKNAVSNGRELSQYAGKIGEIVGAKESLQKKVNKKKAAHQSTDFEEFMALERVKEQEDELKQIMIYCGRPGLWQDWVRFQVEARKARREAEEANKKKIQWWIEVTIISVAMIVGVAALVLFVWWLYHRQRASGV
jgi:cobalamin biosynthesis Mg chelatase CobN